MNNNHNNNNKKSNICSFTFISQAEIPVYVTGVQRSWNFLKLEFDRQSDGLPSPNARYYQTLYTGPKLFAVDDNDVVYYHDAEQWTPYSSASIIIYSYDSDFVEDEDESNDVCVLSPDFHYDEILNKRQISDAIVLWYFKDKVNVSLDNDENDHWLPYSDIENEMIEEAYQRKSDTESFIELDAYLIDFNQLVQVSKLDSTKQQTIKRVIESNNERKCILQERFSEPLSQVSPTSYTFGHEYEWSPLIMQWIQSKVGKHCLFNANKCVRKAIEGIMTEGRLIGKEIEASYLVRKLEPCKRLLIKDISKICVHLFTRASFLYRVVNTALRNSDLSKIDTLGPYCYLLRAYIRSAGTEYNGYLYRGCNLAEEQVSQYRNAVSTKEWKTWRSFTSTSKNQQVVEIFGENTLFIINVKEIGISSNRAFNIQHISQFPDEEEVLLPAGVLFQIVDVQKDEKTKKWIIHLQL
ncbi:unnamed protein product [Adineta steineri]|uniref:NAD(P)(+)--arginine ADP-ribosyltransferase n=1 Tax=Adineta steineri TaxID=433720 RepID=A0A819IXU9_9BILA|nr:unnamed protein product [Adineta steineri]